MASLSRTTNEVSANDRHDTNSRIVAEPSRLFQMSKVPWNQQKHRLLDLFNNRGRSVKDIHKMITDEGHIARYV